jgi:hypothetical protein
VARITSRGVAHTGKLSRKYVLNMVNLSNSATTAAWCVDTPAGFISKILCAADYQHVADVWPDFGHSGRKRHAVVVVSDPRRARGRAIDNLIAWPYGHAGARVAPVIFG